MSRFQQYPLTKVVEIHGQTMTVPLSTRYVSVDFVGQVKAWVHPVRFNDGWVMSLGEIPERGTSVGIVERDHRNRIPMDIYELPADA